MTKEEMKLRIKKDALRVIKSVQTLPNYRVAGALGSQLLRAGASVGAVYRAACRAKSTADFVNKLKIVEEEGDEITAIVVSAIKTTRQNSGAFRPSPLFAEAPEMSSRP